MTGTRHVGPEARPFGKAIDILARAQVPFLVGGAYAVERYVGYRRPTKDIDLFVRPEDCWTALTALERAGYRAQLLDPVWLAKAFWREFYIDLIFGSGNGVCVVDDGWFAHAPSDTVLGRSVKLCPPEEIIWSKMFVMEHGRYDGADIAHLIRVCGRSMDWERLLQRVEGHWELLLYHLVQYGYIYPFETDAVPAWVISELLRRLQTIPAASISSKRVCRGTLLSRDQFVTDIRQWSYIDGRVLVFEQGSG